MNQNQEFCIAANVIINAVKQHVSPFPIAEHDYFGLYGFITGPYAYHLYPVFLGLKNEINIFLAYIGPQMPKKITSFDELFTA